MHAKLRSLLDMLYGLTEMPIDKSWKPCFSAKLVW